MPVGTHRTAVSDDRSVPTPIDYEPISAEESTVVVVGGTSGIGRAISLAFATEGANVVPTSRSEERVAETADEVRERGGEALAITCDVTDRESLAALADAAVERFGEVDTLVNSPGAIARAAVPDVTDDEWDRVLDVQLTGVHRTVQTFVTRTGVESVVNVASLSSLLGIEDLAAYSAAKGGIDGYTHAAAKDLGPDVRVNAVRPGFVATPQTADAYAEGSHRYERIVERSSIGRIGRPEDIAGAVVYLASPAASYVTGETITVDGGFTPSAF